MKELIPCFYIVDEKNAAVSLMNRITAAKLISVSLCEWIRNF